MNGGPNRRIKDAFSFFDIVCSGPELSVWSLPHNIHLRKHVCSTYM